MNEVNRIWNRLISIKLGDCTIDSNDELVIRKDIEDRLEAGWTPGEIVFLLSWTEYFNNVTREETCLRMMSDINETVGKRLMEYTPL